jgi:hypothetical protein
MGRRGGPRLLDRVGVRLGSGVGGEVAGRSPRVVGRALASVALFGLILALPARPATASGRGASRPDYPVPSRFICGPHVCVHWVETTDDAPPLVDANANHVPDQVDRTLAAFGTAWRVEVRRMGFRAPRSDLESKDHGPDGRLDVYLMDVGLRDLAGYVSTDDPHATDDGYPYRDYSAYVVVDDDFSPSQLGWSAGLAGLRVTAAHELFHAVQYAYDAGEDPWMMEGTAVWIEDQVADEVDANRGWLRDSPLTQPWVPVDSSRGLHGYGAWIFWRFLAEQTGAHGRPDPTIIRRIWELAADGPGDPNLYSAQAVERALESRGRSFREELAAFGVWNLAPAAFYREGGAYPAAPVYQHHRISVAHPISGWSTLRLDHFATGAAAFEPGVGGPAHSSLRLALDAPPTRLGSAARVVVFQRSGGFRVIAIGLDLHGDADVRVPFGRSTVRRVVLLYANAGQSFRCWMGGGYSCNGFSRNDRMPFSYLAALVR